jgi:hypothetical protein
MLLSGGKEIHDAVIRARLCGEDWASRLIG